MPIRTSQKPDFIENFLIKRTEATVNTAFLWILILKQLSKQRLTATQLRKQIARTHHNPHRTTLYTSLYLLQTMKLIQKASLSNDKLYKITPKGEYVLQRSIKHLKLNLSIVLGGE